MGTGDMKLERKVLPNGMVLLAVANSASPAAHLRCLLSAGAAFDEGRPGLACLAARLLDAGTKNRSRAEIYEEVDSLGAILSISEARETVSLDVHFLAKDFPRVVEILSDILVSPMFPEEELERRRAALVTSILTDAQDTEAVCENRLNAEIFPSSHPYHHPIKGSEESVRAITRDDVATFSRKFHTPQRSILALSGDLEAGEALARLEAAMSRDGVESERTSVDFPAPDALDEPVRVIASLPDKSQADIGFGHRGLRRSDPDYYPFLVMNHALGRSGTGGRLGTEIREKRGLAYYAYSAFAAGIGAGAFLVRAGVNPARVDAAVECIFSELRRVAAEGVTEAEVEESKQYLIGSLPRRLETPAGIARHLADAERLELGADYTERFPELVGAVSVSDCRRVAGSRLEPDQGALVIVGPPKGEAGKTGSAIAERLTRSV